MYPKCALRLLSCFAAALVLGPALARATEYVARPIADAALDATRPNESFGNAVSLDLAPDVGRAVMKFDLSPVPPDARVQSVTLCLFCRATNGAPSVNIAPASARWEEGNGDYDGTQPGEVTWQSHA